MLKKSLGGDRIGSGSKMDVNLHAFQSSTHNVTQITRTTQAVGTLIPIYKRLLLKDNKIDIDLNALCFTNPTEGPCFGEYELQVHVYTAPLRLYQGKLHMNMLEQGTKMEDIKFPVIEFEADKINWNENPDNQQINESCIHKYLGTSGIGDAELSNVQSTVSRTRNAMPILMYWDIYGNYYANQQEGIGYVVHTQELPTNIQILTVHCDINGVEQPTLWPWGPTSWHFLGSQNKEILVNYKSLASEDLLPENFYFITTDDEYVAATGWFTNFESGTYEIFPDGSANKWIKITGFGPNDETVKFYAAQQYDKLAISEPHLTEFPLQNLNEMRMDVLAAVKQTAPFKIDKNGWAPYSTSLGKTQNQVWSKKFDQEGLGVRTYKSDIFNNWLDTAAIDEINEQSRIQIDENGSFTMNSFLLMEKLFKYLNRIQLSGNTVDDWEEAAYGTKSHRPTEKPIFEGAMHRKITFSEVVSTAAGAGQPLGTLAATGRMGGQQKGGKISIRVDEASYVMAIASIVPIIDYSQGNDWDGDLQSYEDLHNPNFDKIGFQDLPTDWMASWDTRLTPEGVPIYRSAGKQPSWIHYQTNYNKNFGEFAKYTSEGWMVNGRNYEADSDLKTIKDLTTYIDPKKWNNIFAYKNRSAQNFRMQYLIEAKQRLLMSANQIPGL